VRRAAGKVTDLDVAEAGASLNSAQSQLRAAKARDSEVKRALDLLLGRYPAADVEVPSSLFRCRRRVRPDCPRRC